MHDIRVTLAGILQAMLHQLASTDTFPPGSNLLFHWAVASLDLGPRDEGSPPQRKLRRCTKLSPIVGSDSLSRACTLGILAVRMCSPQIHEEAFAVCVVTCRCNRQHPSTCGQSGPGCVVMHDYSKPAPAGRLARLLVRAARPHRAGERWDVYMPHAELRWCRPGVPAGASMCSCRELLQPEAGRPAGPAGYDMLLHACRVEPCSSRRNQQPSSVFPGEL